MRKTDALGVAIRLIERIDEKLIFPSDFTPEGLFSLLTEKPNGLITWSEFGSFLVGANTKTYQAGIKEFLTDAYEIARRK